MRHGPDDVLRDEVEVPLGDVVLGAQLLLLLDKLLPLGRLKVRLEHVEDGRPDEEVRERADDQ